MATAGDFGIWICDEKNDRTRVYVNQKTTIREIKVKFITKKMEKEKSTLFHLLKDNCSLDDDVTVHSSKITKGEVLIKANKEQRKLKKIKTEPTLQSVYGGTGSSNRKKDLVPSTKRSRSFTEPAQTFKQKVTTKIIHTDQTGGHMEKREQNGFADKKITLMRNVQPAPTEQKQVVATSTTAPVSVKPEDFEKSRPLSTMTTRSSSMNNLSALDTDLLYQDAMEKAMEHSLSSSSAETLKFSEALTPFVGKLTASVQNAELLSDQLSQEGLITNSLHRDMINTMGMLNSLKATKLIDSVRCLLKTSPRPVEILKSFCTAISYDPALRTFISKIEERVGISLTEVQTPNVKRMVPSARSRCNKCVISENDIANIVYRTVMDVQHKWYLLGTVLKLRTEELMEIKQSHHNSLGSCYCEMMQRWIHSTSNQFLPTWQILTSALIRPLELGELAKELKKEYCYTCCYR